MCKERCSDLFEYIILIIYGSDSGQPRKPQSEQSASQAPPICFLILGWGTKFPTVVPIYSVM